MQLDCLPIRHGSAAENMAVDFLLLQRYPREGNARFRHYGWHRAAFTFGYSQPLAFARSQTPSDEPIELCRRPSGGGVVDHRHDWTYALVIPRAHDLYEARAVDSYKLVHACIARSLQTLGQPATLKEAGHVETIRGPGVCFEQAETHDVIHPITGNKIAGAAQKRAREGILFQGSIARDTVCANLDWEAFRSLFTGDLAAALGLRAVETSWPDFVEHELEGLIENYSTEEWNARR